MDFHNSNFPQKSLENKATFVNFSNLLMVKVRFSSGSAKQFHKREVTQPPPGPETNGGVTGAVNPTLCETALQRPETRLVGSDSHCPFM